MVLILLGSRYGSLYLCLLQTDLIQIQVELPASSVNKDYKNDISLELVQRFYQVLLEHLLCVGEDMHPSLLPDSDGVSHPPPACVQFNSDDPLVLEGEGANQHSPLVLVVLEGGQDGGQEGEIPNSRPSHISSPGFENYAHLTQAMVFICPVSVLDPHLQDVKKISK